jgi:small subunit ribosomal protein S10
MERIRIRMEAYDHELLDQSAVELVNKAKETGAQVKGPIPLPTRVERYTVLRSPHVDKKSREQFEMRTHKRLIDITKASVNTVNSIANVQMPAGVHITVKA